MIQILIILMAVATLVQCAAPKYFVCPEDINIGWKSAPPYIFSDKDGTMSGPLVDILRKSLARCCKDNVSINYEEEFTDYSVLVEKSLNSTFDMVLPIRTNLRKKIFLAFPFINFVESPGAVLYNTGTRSAKRAILNTMIASVPLVSVLLVLVAIFGVAFWIAETVPTKAGEPRNIFQMMEEVFDGIWWSFITVATVGYGDIFPTRLSSRIVCYVWLLFSSVAIAAYTATVTSILISECFSADLKVTGSNIAVVNGSKEHSLVLKKNGFPTVYRDMNDLIESIATDDNVQGGVVELYAASYHQENLKNYRIQTVFEDVSATGIVLRTRTVKLYKCLKNYVMDSQNEIYTNIREKFPPLKTNFTVSTSEETSRSLLSPSTENLKQTLLSLSCSILILCILGIIRDRFYLSKRSEKKTDSMENFLLLHSIKSQYRANLQSLMVELNSDILKMQECLEKMTTNLDTNLVNTANLFRASVKNTSKELQG